MATLFGKSTRKRVRTDDALLPEQSSSLTKATAAEESSRTRVIETKKPLSTYATFEDLGLADPLIKTCRELGFRKPTPVQRVVIPFLLQQRHSHLMALASTGSGKTAAFCLPILQHLSEDPYGIYAVVLTPTRELAKQIHQQVVALGSSYRVQSALVVGGLDSVRQSCELDQRPHFCVATPGRLATLLRGPQPPKLGQVQYLVLDEADRLLTPHSGFERDVAELLLHCTSNKPRRMPCQTLLFSATMTKSLESLEDIAGSGLGRLPLEKFMIQDHAVENADSAKLIKTNKSSSKEDINDESDEESSVKKMKQESNGDEGDDEPDEGGKSIPKIPEGLSQQYIFMPSRVRDAYLLAAVRTLMAYGGRSPDQVVAEAKKLKRDKRKKFSKQSKDEYDHEKEATKARSAIIFVSTCERAALVSGILSHVGVENVALHSLLSQNRRLASLGKFKSQQVRVLVATDVASRGLDIPTVDLVINSELPRSAFCYVHRVGRTARAGRRGKAISLVAESEVALVHAAERVSGRALEKCTEVTDDIAIQLLGSVTKAARLTKMKLMEIGFDELVEKFKERKARDAKERERIEKALKKMGN
ncbi:ATP-dependent RNA helicase DDX49/DBP8 [Fistulifera solaris]|uniref:ATP-dependent RNA helicase DDX49/DBP8 n=1 Tax=Fistulifera solaris TaxID=1519565 RepID=A0A1Z5JNX3_FISSO|nr:ATP-dependent RNA helicase DDX49/DBP8 [Fistulifera solaris]|eukprot:GAX15458.1 ATP-dependent RNA helicase DDX49/DBP8 [Fistulifera solaris]